MKAQELLKRFNDGEKDLVFDIRAQDRYDIYHMPHVRHINTNELTGNPDKYIDSKEQEVFITCNSGNTSGTATAILKAKGYNVISVEGGMNPLLDKIGLDTVACQVK